MANPAPIEAITSAAAFSERCRRPIRLPIAGCPCDLWIVRLEPTEPLVADAMSLLSPEEKARAEAYATAELRDLFARCRAALRRVLASYLGADPRSISLSAKRFVQPRVLHDGAPHFSVSRSGNVAAIAVAEVGPIGVDLEVLSSCHTSHIRRVLTEGEQSLVRFDVNPHAAALSCWTRKEAALKAAGVGLSIEPSAVDTSTGLVDDLVGGPWLLTDFRWSDQVGAIATPGASRALPSRRVIRHRYAGH
jgi:4'-phosphopantetheinyl transferase